MYLPVIFHKLPSCVYSLNVFFLLSPSHFCQSHFWPILSKVPSVLLSNTGGPFSEVINLTLVFFCSGFYGNNTITQLGLIRPCPRSPCPTAEPCEPRGDRPVPANRAQNTNQADVWRFIQALPSALFSAALARARPVWNKPIINGSCLWV